MKVPSEEIYSKINHPRFSVDGLCYFMACTALKWTLLKNQTVFKLSRLHCSKDRTVLPVKSISDSVVICY